MKGLLNRAALVSGFVACAAVTTAQAVSAPGYDIPYVELGGEFVSVDDIRANDDGIGGRLRLGFPIGIANSAIELSIYDNVFERDLDGDDDYQSGFFVNYVYDLGGLLNTRVRPFVLGGLGFAEDDILGNNDTHLGLDAGLGALVPLGLPFAKGLSLRADARYQYQFNKEHYPGEDSVADVRFFVGAHIPLSAYFEAKGKPQKTRDCELAVVDPTTGRTDCVSDSDRDGVIDGRDKCPGTRRGASVNANGCVASGPDSDGDGVPDNFDRCPETVVGAAVDGNGCPVRQIVVLNGVNFNTGSAALTDGAKQVLDGVVETLRSQRASLIEIAGHTDSRGDAQSNLALSQKRAESVRDYLIERGITASRLTARGYGEYEPIASNDTAGGREENRRVEFRVVAN